MLHFRGFLPMALELDFEGNTKNINPIIMSSLLYIIAVILLIGWLVGVFVYSVTGLIHILLVLALVAIIFRLIGGR